MRIKANLFAATYALILAFAGIAFGKSDDCDCAIVNALRFPPRGAPEIILRFEIIDKYTHFPIRRARIRIEDNRGGSNQTWMGNNNGIAIFVGYTRTCLPRDGTIEVSAEDYRYETKAISINNLLGEKHNFRIFLYGHRHNWTDENQIPPVEEIIKKVETKRYRVGIKEVSSGMGFNWVNYAPPIFEYSFELERIRASRGADKYRSRDRRY